MFKPKCLNKVASFSIFKEQTTEHTKYTDIDHNLNSCIFILTMGERKAGEECRAFSGLKIGGYNFQSSKVFGKGFGASVSQLLVA